MAAGRVVTRDIELGFAEGGNAGGKPLLLLHGMLEGWSTYASVLAPLRRHFKVYALDWRGHGRSGRPTRPDYRIEHYFRDVVAFIEQVIKRPTVVVGHSLGGLVAVHLAARHPDLVTGLSLEDPPLFVTEGGVMKSWFGPFLRDLGMLMAEREVRGITIPTFADRIGRLVNPRPRHTMPFADRVQALGKVLRSRAGRTAAQSSEEASRLEAGFWSYLSGEPVRMADFMPRADVMALARALSIVDSRVPGAAVRPNFSSGFPHETSLRGIRCPTLYWEADRHLFGVLAPEQVSFAQSCLAGDRTEWIYAEFCGHHIHEDAPGLFSDRIISTFDS